MFRVFCIVIIFGLFRDLNSAPRTMRKIKFDPNYVRIVNEMKILEPRISKEDLRMVMTLGLVQGALQVKKRMERNLTDNVADLILNLDMSDKTKTMTKIEKIEKIIDRDWQAIQVLGGALDFARRALTAREFQMDMKNVYVERNNRLKNLRYTKDDNMRERLEYLKKDIMEHVDMMHKTIDNKTHATIDYLEKIRNLNVNRVPKTTTTTSRSILEENVLRSILVETIDQNLIDAGRRQDLQVEIIDQEKEKHTEGDASSEESGGSGQGGIVGLIASLSGGEEGSDVGALLGALTGLISNLFGPGGLDIQSLLASGTSLISGLLSGDKNFGTVLGEYVGTAVDGLSGGGGAIDNGKFFGNFLGTVIAQLSADPEDDDEPPKPQLFLQNFISSFMSAKNKGEEIPEEDQRDGQNGSDSFGFIKHIVRAVVGGVTSFILNASLGSSGGSSQGSGALFSSSSHPKHSD